MWSTYQKSHRQLNFLHRINAIITYAFRDIQSNFIKIIILKLKCKDIYKLIDCRETYFLDSLAIAVDVTCSIFKANPSSDLQYHWEMRYDWETLNVIATKLHDDDISEDEVLWVLQRRILYPKLKSSINLILKSYKTWFCCFIP